MMSQPSFAFDSSSPFSSSVSGVKRPAPSPPFTDGTCAPLWSSPASESSTPHKKRRPNLANGFSGLSLSEVAAVNPNHARSPEYLDDDETPGYPAHHKDIAVEVLPETPSKSKRSAGGSRLWSHTGSTSSSTSDNGDEADYDSDVTFRLPSSRLERVQQPDSVHLPEHDSPAHNHVFDIEDLMESSSNRKRRHRDTDFISQPTRKKKRDGDMDIDMEGDRPDRLEDGIEEITRAPERGRRHRSHWHEPEKDRIVVTSLSSSPSSSRSSSRDSSSPRRHLSQPGSQGFTLSPSLLTHLLGTQKESWSDLPPLTDSHQKGLVLYRPLGIPPGVDMRWDEIVKRWKDRTTDEVQDDSSRFEVVDDDEQLQAFGGEPIMPVISEYTDQDVPMEVE